MRRKPKGQKYRNLFARANATEHQHSIDGACVKWSAKSDDLGEAAAVRDLWEDRKVISSAAPVVRVPTFGEFVVRCLGEPTGNLAATTRSDRRS